MLSYQESKLTTHVKYESTFFETFMSSLIASKVKLLFLFIVRTIFCATVSNLCNRNYLLVILLYTSVLLSTKNCSVDIYNSDLQTTTVSFTCNFIQGWLNSYYSPSALSCPFIVQHNHSNERSWSRTFMFSPARELYCHLIFVCVLRPYFCLCVRIFVYPFLFSHACCCFWFIYN